MYLDQYIDLNVLEKHIREGLITRRLHPKHPLAILNYSKTAMDKTHNDEVLRRCRGLIYDHSTMEVVARPMPAFFNVNDARYQETSLSWITDVIAKLPGVSLEVSEKLDGSMGIVYQYGDHPPEVATRGSFESPQALWATAYLRGTDVYKILDGHTYIVEIIYPENQIVVDYGGRADLTLLTIIYTEDGTEVDYEALVQIGRLMRIPVVPLHNISPAQCAVQNERNREGYVLKFTIPGRPVQRFKCKFEDYRLAHKAMFGMNSRDVWEMLKDGKDIDFSLFASATRGFKTWLQDRVGDLVAEFERRKYMVDRWVLKAQELPYESPAHAAPKSPHRKDVAELFRIFSGDLLGACFAAYDGKDYEAVIWKGLRPARAVSYREMPAEAE